MLGISLTTSLMGDRDRADGNCVRCIQDETATSILEISNHKTLIKIVGILGRETNPKANTLLFYIYDDGTVEKKIIPFSSQYLCISLYVSRGKRIFLIISS